MTATTVVDAGANDGCLSSESATYSTAADGGTIANDPGGGGELWVGQLVLGDFACYESFVAFDLAAAGIPAHHDIVDATLATYLIGDSTSAGDFLLGARETDWGTTVTAADWLSRSEITALAGGTLANLSTNGIGALSDYKDWNSTGLDAAVDANRAGTLKLLLYSGSHRVGAAPSGAEFVEFASADTAAPATLTVEHVGVLVDHTPTGGVQVGGVADVDPLLHHHPQGGAQVDGTAALAFVHGSTQLAPSDLVVEWDFDNDGDFDETVEDVTGYLVTGESLTGRDFPSQLTGKAGPGQLTLTLLNEDDRFGYFNADSPLTTGGNSLKTGRKIRVRTADAADPDPPLLARDLFRSTGPLVDDELGNAWDIPTLLDASIHGATLAGRGIAEQTVQGEEAIAVVDVGTEDFYAQVTIPVVDYNNAVGIAYRVDDADNFGSVFVATSAIWLGETVGGALTTWSSIPIERREEITIGVLVQGATATAYLEGVPVLEDDAYTSTTSSTRVGPYGFWTNQRPPRWRDFWAWDGLPTETEGVLWTGQITSVVPRAPLGSGPKTAEVRAEGPLANAAQVEVRPPATTGGVGSAATATTGILAGAALAAARLLHPPGPIDAGDVELGSVGLSRGKALPALRQFEEAELGFVHETQEGRIGFEARSGRDATGPAVAAFSDAPGAQFAPADVELGDWRRDIFNRVTAQVAPRTATVEVIGSHHNSTAGGVRNDCDYPLPSSPTAEAGNLAVIMFARGNGTSGLEWTTPQGWTAYREDAKDNIGKVRVFAKALTADDLGTTPTFYEDTSNTGGDWVAQLVIFSNWYGDVDQAVEVAFHGYGPPNTMTQAQAGENDPPPVFPAWAPGPSLFVAYRAGMTGTPAVASSITEDDVPDGYGNPGQTAPSGYNVAQQVAIREAAGVHVEKPSPFVEGATEFGGFLSAETCTIAVRGYEGDLASMGAATVEEVVVEDLDSQIEHNAILTHENPARLFVDDTDATDYGELVLERHADDKPLLTLTFDAHKNAAYRAQAMRRRVGHKVRVVARYSIGLGIEADFYIESISNRWPDPLAWEVTWQLSPA